MKRLPFDALCTAAVVSEAQPLVGGQVSGAGAAGQAAVALVLRRGRERGLLVLSASAEYPCAFVARERLALDKSDFSEQLARHLKGKALSGIRQLGFDRAIELTFEPGAFQLYAFLFGTHANLVLGAQAGKVIATLRKADAFRIGAVIKPEPPRAESLEEALKSRDSGGSAALALALQMHGEQAVLRAVAQASGYLHPEGAYPLAVSAAAEPRESFSDAVAAVFATVERERAQKQQEQAIARLKQEVEAKERALAQVEAAIQSGDRARDLQIRAELLLAYQHQVPEGATEFKAMGYDGEEVTIPLDPKLSPVENAGRLFAKAKRAKSGRAGLIARREELQRQIESMRQRLESLDIGEILITSTTKRKRRRDRPYEGHKIRETQDPRGYEVLWGMNAEANDYLTRRVARPNDLWLHARGATGSHVVIRTNNQPDRVPRDTILFAAHIAARNSSQKHASLVPVAYTLAKYVRRARHAPPGTVTLSREKVLFVRPGLDKG